MSLHKLARELEETGRQTAAMVEGITFSIKDLAQRYKPIHPDTIAAYNQVVLKYK